MPRNTVAFLAVAIVAGVFAFGDIEPGTTQIARILFFAFVVLFVVSLVAAMSRPGR